MDADEFLRAGADIEAAAGLAGALDPGHVQVDVSHEIGPTFVTT